MRSKKKQVGIFVLGAFCFGLVFLLFLRPAQPKLIVPLADGSSFVLAGTDSGSKLYCGGGLWQRFLCKALRRQLPAFIHNQPGIFASVYTNGIALSFRRKKPGGLQTAWNGTGQLYFLDDSGAEHTVSKRCVGFVTEEREQVETVVEENVDWELPMLHDAELRLRIRETNNLTGSVSTHNFQVKNPVL